MEDFRSETSESVASFMMSTPIWSDSWGLCNAANNEGNIQIHEISGIIYVAFPALPMIQLGNLVDFIPAGDGFFSAVSTTLAADEPPPMVDSAILELFLSSFEFVQSQIEQGMETQTKKLVVLTGHSAGGAVASLTALSLLSLPSPSFHLLCITFGSPLLTNQSLSSLISRSRLDHNFCHVVSIHDPIPRLLLSPPLSPNLTHQISTLVNLQDSFLMTRTHQFSPFGTYLFCSDNGGVCLDNASSVRNMLLLLSTTRTPIIEHHLKYQHYVSTLSRQFLKSRTFLGDDNTNSSGVLFAVESLGFSNQELAGVAVKECIETATRTVRAPIIRATELAIELGNVLSSRLEIQLYKDRCDNSDEQLGYYDFFKRGSLRRDFKANLSRLKLAYFWDKVIVMIENNELPFDFHLGKKWVYASQFYQLLTEPLDIANFYKKRTAENPGHYMEEGNRPKRYVVIDKWWRRGGEPHKAKGVRSRYTSATQDTCFWAKLEEAKECLEEIRKENDPQRLNLLWQKIVGFESYAKKLKEKKEVSIDVLARRSSYSLWVENLEAFRSELGTNGFHMIIDESSAMET